MKLFKKIARKVALFQKFKTFNINGLSVFGTKKSTVNFDDVTQLIKFHFEENSSPNHICRSTLHEALTRLSGEPALIVETGSSAWGTNSSLLFDGYVRSFGGSFETVDLRIEPLLTLQDQCSSNTQLHCDDSVSFLKGWSSKNSGVKIDLLYLDSWDVEWSNPNPSGLHGLAEFLSASSHMKKGSLLLIDDTPKDENFYIASSVDKPAFSDYFIKNGFYPGKGSLVRQLLLSLGRGKEIAHEYQLLWEF